MEVWSCQATPQKTDSPWFNLPPKSLPMFYPLTPHLLYSGFPPCPWEYLVNWGLRKLRILFLSLQLCLHLTPSLSYYPLPSPPLLHHPFSFSFLLLLFSIRQTDASPPSLVLPAATSITGWGISNSLPHSPIPQFTKLCTWQEHDLLPSLLDVASLHWEVPRINKYAFSK